MIKVCHLINQLDVGGMENALINLLNSFDSDFYHTILAVKSVDIEMKNRILSDRVNVLSYSDLGIDLFNKLTFLGLARYLKSENYNILHSRNIPLFLEGHFAQMLCGVKHIHSYHGVGADFDGLSRKIYNIVSKYFIKTESCSFATLTNEMVGEMAQLYNIDMDCISILPNGVDLDRFLDIPNESLKHIREKIGLPEDAIVIGCVGRLTPVKNIPHLIKIFYSLVGDLGDALCLLLVGDGSMKFEIEDLISRLSLEDRVFLVGNVSDVRDYLYLMDIYAQFSHSEGCSNSLLEAMSCGLPCVVSDVGGNRDILVTGKDGYLIDNSCATKQKSVLTNLCLDESLRIDIGSCARNKIISSWSLPSMRKRYSLFYKNVLCK